MIKLSIDLLLKRLLFKDQNGNKTKQVKIRRKVRKRWDYVTNEFIFISVKVVDNGAASREYYLFCEKHLLEKVFICERLPLSFQRKKKTGGIRRLLIHY